MSRSILLVSLVAVVACRDPVSSDPLASMPSVHMAVAAPEISNVHMPLVPATIVGPCTGEPITISGELHVVAKSWQVADSIRIQTHLNLNVAGVGVATGRKYRLQQITNADQEFVLGTPDGSAHQVFHLHLISQGAVPNWYVTMNGSYEFSAAGVEFVPRKWETVCQ